MKLIRRAIFALLYLSGISTLYRVITRSRARVLCYHRISEKQRDPLLDVSAAAFERQLEYLSIAYRPVPLPEIVEAVEAGKPFTPGAVALTFDDGSEDWIARAMPLLERHAVPAAFFMCTGYLDQYLIPYPNNHLPARALTTQELHTLARHPLVTIGGHTVHHPHLSLLSYEEARAEARASRTTLESILQKPVNLFTYPFGDAPDYNNETKQAVRDAGYRAAFSLIERSINKSDRDPYDLPRMVIFDEPLWVFKVRVSGIIDDMSHALAQLKRKLKSRGNAASAAPLPAGNPQSNLDATVRRADPAVSVIIPVLNAEKFLAETLESVRRQTFENWEALIMDDCSEDKTGEIALNYAARDPRFIYIRNSRRLGIQQNLNLGVQRARGPYIAPLDGDDLWCDPGKLAQQVSFLDSHPEAVLISGGFVMIDAVSKEVQTSFSDAWFNADKIRSRLLLENIIPHSAACYRREAFLTAGGYNSEFKVTGDYDLWLRLALMGTLQKTEDIHLHHRMHANNFSLLRHKRKVWEELKLVRRYRRHYPHGSAALAYRLISLAASLIPSHIRRMLARAVRYRERRIAMLKNIAQSPATVMKSDPSAGEYHLSKETPGTAVIADKFKLVEIQDFSKLTPEMRKDWENLIVENSASFFQSPLWTETWWKHFGSGKRLLILFAYGSDGILAAVFPGMISAQRMHIRKMSVLGFIGTPLNDVNDIPISQRQPAALDAIMHALVHQYGQIWDIAKFQEIPDSSPLIAHCRQEGIFRSLFVYESINRPLWVRTSANGAAGTAPSYSKTDLNQRFNKLKRLSAPRFRPAIPKNELTSALPQVFAMHEARARQTSFVSAFRDPRMRAFMEELLSHGEGVFTAQLSAMNAGDSAIACACLLNTPERQTYYLNAFDPAWHHYSPAGLLLREMLREFHHTGRTIFDFGRGDWPYKLRFSNGTERNVTVLATLRYPAWTAALRAIAAGKAFVKQSESLQQAYYRLKKWFLEIKLADS